jgi:aspartate beta-hydroxylase
MKLNRFVIPPLPLLYLPSLHPFSRIPRQHSHAFFSALAPQTHVTSHYGPTNKKLRCQFPLVVPPSPSGDALCTLTVAGITQPILPGKCIIFDDSFLHEARNTALPLQTPISPAAEQGAFACDGTGPRVVLIFDIWHPDLSEEEVREMERRRRTGRRREETRGIKGGEKHKGRGR